MVGKRSPQTRSINRLISPPDSVLSKCRRSRHLEFQHIKRRHHLMVDHVHMLVSIPPKYAVSQLVGYIKGKSAIHLARIYGERKRNFVGQHIKNQEKEDMRLEQMNLWR